MNVIGSDRKMLEKCNACGETGLFLHQAVYDGFTKVGDEKICAACGARQPSAPESTAARPPQKPRLADLVFGTDPLPEKPSLTADASHLQICRRCLHYMVNPFTQRCAVHDQEVQALDSCPQFEMREPTES